MDEPGGERAPDRVPLAVLVWVLVIALGLAGWWWTSNPPDPGGGPAPPGGLLSLPAPPGSEPSPAPPLAAAHASGLADLIQAEDLVAVLLPRTDEAVFGRGTVLGPGGSLVYGSAAPTTEDYLLEVACRGGGAVTLEITLPNLGAESQALACDGEVREVVLSYRFGHATIRVWAPPEADFTALFAFQVRPQ
jgi:hypothetical protein